MDKIMSLEPVENPTKILKIYLERYFSVCYCTISNL